LFDHEMVNKMENDNEVKVLDLNFRGIPHTIAVFLIPHPRGAILIECGPGSTIPALVAALSAYDLKPSNITDVFLTHIHLDHAGAAGWLAQHGARVHVHPLGAPHLLEPVKLLASASRIYGDLMDELWGEFLPVPEEQLSVVSDGEIVEVENIRIRALNTPGHANHHYVYFYNDVCFSGDIGGVRLPGPPHLSLPMPPPEFNLEKWRDSLKSLQQQDFSRIAPTHFGIFTDRDWHLSTLAKTLEVVDNWISEVLPRNLPLETLNRYFVEWFQANARADGVDESTINAYETVNPSWMSSQGIQRYWNKYRTNLV
jgi:glyoxylase-like metal-dependent hydrolase (beta-lactamase superfamily II)